MFKALFLLSLIFLVLFTGCTQQTGPAQTQKTCAELGGYVCASGESCFGAKLNASDTLNCCNTPCSVMQKDEEAEEPEIVEGSGEPEIIPPQEEKSLEGLNLKLSDFPEGFKLNDLETGYVKNALDYSDGNAEHAEWLVNNGWIENHKIVVQKNSEEEILGQPILLASYSVSVSKYNKASDYKNYFSESMKERREDFEQNIEIQEDLATALKEENQSYELKSVSILQINIGDNSTCQKMLVYNTFLDTSMPVYYCYFTVENYYVNFWAEGKGRNISDEEVVEYAGILEQRIRNQ